MSAVRRTLILMGLLSLGTLLLGAVRELLIAGDLQDGPQADVFYRGTAILAAGRNFTLAVLRAHWIPAGPSLDRRGVWSAGVRTCGAVTIVGWAALAAVIPPGAWLSATTLWFVGGIALATAGAATRALCERAGHETVGVVTDWAPLLLTIAGVGLVGGITGAVAGLTVGLMASAVGLLPLARIGRVAQRSTRAYSHRVSTALYLDTLIYINLGLLDSLLSPQLFDVGQFAVLNYSYFLVNAVLAIPTAGATIVALRAGQAEEDRSGMRRWALIAGVVAALLVLLGGWALTWPWVLAAIDGAVGWTFSEQTRDLVLIGAPFAGLRLANTIGRQRRVVGDPQGLVRWDLAGLVLRVPILWFGAAMIGPAASPVALAVAELVQLVAWITWRPTSRP